MLIAYEERIRILETENQKLKTELSKVSKLAVTDPLTELGNRRDFDISISKYAEIARRNDLNLFLVMIDADDFKIINDTKGHDEGDRVLINIADSIRRAIRVEDEAFRIGGDEFAILAIDGTCQDIARTVCRRLKRLASISLSIGIVKYRSEPVTDFIKSSDEMMYTSKRNGKGFISFINEENQLIYDR